MVWLQGTAEFIDSRDDLASLFLSITWLCCPACRFHSQAHFLQGAARHLAALAFRVHGAEGKYSTSLSMEHLLTI